jgi:hypothetical protein
LVYTLQIILGMVGTVGQARTTSADAAAQSDFLIAPSGKLVVEDIPLFTQQITFLYRLE